MSTTENQKNARAGTYTGMVCGLLLFLFFIVSWSIPTPAVPPEELGMEVNLGNSDIGSGDIQPLIPEAPSREEQQVNTPPKTQVTAAEPVKEVATDDNDKEAPEAVVHKPAKPEPKATKQERRLFVVALVEDRVRQLDQGALDAASVWG